ATVFATLFATDAKAFQTRVDALADTVCAGDPRTKEQRRADALGALGHGTDRLACLCGSPDCPAAANPPPNGVIVYVVAHQDTITTPPGSGQLHQPQAPTPSDPPAPDESQAVEEVNDSAAQNSSRANGADEPADEPDAESDTTPAGGEPVDECAGLDGVAPPRFTKPLREMTLTEALTDTDPGYLSTIPAAVMMGGLFLPGAIARRAAHGATLRRIIHPGQAPPEPRYTPTAALAEFVRARDLTCRFPGCTVPATSCDVDHTIAWPHGPTSASNLKCLCRTKHPFNALVVVRGIVLDHSGDEPSASGGELVLTVPWAVDTTALDPIAYDYKTGV
ncbi:MAG: hypothetical protein JWR46_1410, partial [Mycobacterium sp.]|nr:hypothetical protein [Mycobacterium sp.]